MKIAFNPSTVAALIAPPNNKNITFDLRGQNIFARGVKFCGTDTNTWRDIKINNVSIGSNILDLRNGSNTTLTNINGVVTINSTWRPVVDNLTSDSTTSSLSANQGRVLKALIDGKSDSGHVHDARYLRLAGGWMSGDINFGGDNRIYWGRHTDYASVSFKYNGDADAYMSFITSGNGNEYFKWSHNSGSTNTEWMTLRSDGLRVRGTKVSLEGHSHNDLYYTKTEVNNKLNDKSNINHTHDDRYLRLTGGTMQLGEGLKFHADNNYFGTDEDARIISLLDRNDIICDGGLIIDERATYNGTEYVTELLRIRDSEFKWKGQNILHSGNYNYYSPTLTGTGASGTWNINIRGNADTVDGYHASAFAAASHTHPYLPLSGAYITGTNIANMKVNIRNYFNKKPVGTNCYVGSSNIIYNFQNDSAACDSNSVCGIMALNPGYDNYNHGHFLVSHYGDNRIGMIGLGNQTWYGPHWFAYTSDIPTVTDYYWANIKVSASANTQTQPSVNTIYANNWFRSRGDTGWCNESYGGGWYMSDTSWMRSYNKKGVVAGGFYHSSYGSSEYVLTSDGGARYLPNLYDGRYLRYEGRWNDGSGQNVNNSLGMNFTYTSHGAPHYQGTTVTFEYERESSYRLQLHGTGDNYLYFRNRSPDYGGWHSSGWKKILTNQDTYVTSDGTNRGIINGSEVASTRHLLINGTTWNSDWHWSGLGGQPSWLWGSNDGVNMYIWNPSNFRVNYAASAGNADTVDGYHYNQLPYIQRLNWWSRGESHNANDLLSGTTFAYVDHSNCPTTGTIVAFNCMDLTRYPLQLQGKYNGEELWFRNRNGDNETWQTWRELIHSGNIGSQSVKYASSAGNADTVDGYHATDGRTFTGNINWSVNWNDVWSDGARTHPWYGFDHRYPNTGIYSTTISDYYGLTLKTCNVYISMNFNGNVGIGYTSPSYKLDVNGQVRASGFHHGSVNSDNYMLLAGGGYKSFGGDSNRPIFLGYLNLEHGNDGTISSSFYCLGYSVPFTYTRGGNYCRINIPDTTHQAFYIRAAIASVNYSGGGMDTWVGNHRGEGAWWLHCYASGLNEVKVKGFCQRDSNNDSWWGGNPLWSGNSGVNRITVCIFGNVTLR